MGTVEAKTESTCQAALIQHTKERSREKSVAVRRRKTTRKKKAAPKRTARPLSKSVQATLRAKAKKSKRFTYGQLAKVYRRGQGAYLSSGSRPGVSMSQWAFGRVNSFIRGGHSQDNDIKRARKSTKK